jgi:hypothetical protein
MALAGEQPGPLPERASVFLLHGDHLLLFYHVQLLTHAVRGEAPWFTYPYEFAAPYVESQPYLYYIPLSLVFLLFSWLGDPAAYNALFLVATIFSGIVGFATTRRLTGDDRAAFVAGTFLALVPYRLIASTHGHPSGYYFGFFVLAMLGLVPAWRDRAAGGVGAGQPGTRRGGLAPSRSASAPRIRSGSRGPRTTRTMPSSPRARAALRIGLISSVRVMLPSIGSSPVRACCSISSRMTRSFP